MFLHDRAWKVVLSAGMVALVVALLVGGPLQAVLTVLLSSSPIAGGYIAARRQPAGTRLPWFFFVWAASGFLLATLVREALAALDLSSRFPSPADGLVAVAYGLLIVAIYMFGSIRSAGRNAPAQVDGLIVAVAAATAVWALVLAPYVGDVTVPLNERLLNSGLAMLTTLALATTMRLAVSPGARTTGYYLMALAVASLLINDLGATLASVDRQISTASMYLNPLTGILFSAAALHPESPKLLEPPSTLVLRLTRKRMALLAAALLIVPGLIALSYAMGTETNAPLLVVSSLVTSILVLIRIRMLVTVQERAVDVQRIQREANAELAAATSRQGMRRAGLTATMRLLDDPTVRVAIGEIVDDELRIVDAIGADEELATGISVQLSALPASLLEGLQHRNPTTADGLAPLDLGPSDQDTHDTVSILATPLSTRGHLTGTMLVTTRRPLPATARQSVETLASTVSLALESAALTERLLRRRSEQRFRALVENSSDIVIVIDSQGVISFASPATDRLLGLSEQTLLGTHPARWLHSEDWPILAQLLADGDRPAGEGGNRPEVRVKHADGDYRWFELHTKDLSHDPEIEGLVVNAREVTDRKAAEEQLAHSEARFRVLVQNSSDVVAVVDEDANYTYVSPAVTEMLGYLPEELEGTSAIDLIQAADLDELRSAYPDLLPDVRPDTLGLDRFEVQIPNRAGEMRTLDVGISDLRHEPAIGGIVLNARDITVRKALEHDLRYQALHDSLTGLANRAQFTQRTATALQVTPGDGVGALFVDIDDFKTLNDSLGHAIGDEVLREISDRLATNLLGTTLVARLGGDEFAVLVTNAPIDRVKDIAGQINDLVAQPFVIDGREIRLTCSIGIAMSTELGEADTDARLLLRSADVAMYVAKERGKNGWAVFEERLHASVFERLELKASLTHAVENQEMECYYQPIVSLETGRISGVEALVRWNHPDRGLIGPDAFIPLAEDTGLIIPLGLWVLRQACGQLRTWQLQLPTGASLTMSVNLSVRQLTHDAIIREVREAIEDTQIDPSTLTLEITETSLMADTDLTRHRLAQLRELGVSLAVDDFGTGYSSLQYVQRFPIDIIKIDRSFVTGLGQSANDGAVVQSMIELAKKLGVHTVAEGIETSGQLEVLQTMGADLGQGYWFSRPVPATGIDLLLAEDSSGPTGSAWASFH